MIGLAVPDELVDRLAGSRIVLAGTDADPDPALQLEREVAVDLAARLGAVLVLFDRSGETWGDTDYEQLYAIDRVEEVGRPHLRPQMEAAVAAGVPEVLAWGYALPALESLGRAVAATGADVVVTPESLHQPSLGERWVLRDLPARVAEQAGDATVVVVGDDGAVRTLAG